MPPLIPSRILFPVNAIEHPPLRGKGILRERPGHGDFRLGA
jgi:hypothetical protein